MKAPKSEEAAGKRINAKIDLGSTKVVNTLDIEDLSKKAVFCRCWKSSKVSERASFHLHHLISCVPKIQFPYCDGSHNAHNDTTKDNVGPLIINKAN